MDEYGVSLPVENSVIAITSAHVKSVVSSASATTINTTSRSNPPSFYDVLTSTLDGRRRDIKSSSRGNGADSKGFPLPSLSYLQYRKALKKAKRSMKRRIEAVAVAKEEREKRKKADAEEGEETNLSSANEQDELDEIERKLREHEAWLEREKRAKREFDEKKEEEENRRAEEANSRGEAEATELRINEAAIEAARSIAAAKPPPPTDLSDPKNCDFYMRTGACRYGEVCKRLHPEIEVGTKVLIPHMFDSTALQAVFATPEGEVTLDEPDEELLKAFREFYEDVLPEFRKIGNVRQFKVCSNRVKHLRGNVYVEYELEEEAFVAAQVFGGRWYAGRQLSALVTVVRNWRQATCLQYLQNCCPKGIRCNFLHCFVNPNDEFADADAEKEKEEAKSSGEGADDSKRETNGRTSKTREKANWSRDGRPPPKWKRSPSPPGKHRPFRFRDHYVDDDRIWKKDKEKTKGDDDEVRKSMDSKSKDGEKAANADSDFDDDFCERSRKRRLKKEKGRSRSRGGRRSSSESSGSSSDEMGKKILKATLKSIKSNKSKKKSKKSSKKKLKKTKKKKSRRRELDDSTDSSWDSDASGEGD